jgi:hypothetical protein
MIWKILRANFPQGTYGIAKLFKIPKKLAPKAILCQFFGKKVEDKLRWSVTFENLRNRSNK